MEEKRQRKPNFSDEEKLLLFNQYEKHANILKPKLSSTVTSQKKHQAWAEIQQALNAQNFSVKRTLPEIQKKWQNLSSEARQELSDYERESRKTGGGKGPKPLSLIADKMKSLLGPNTNVITGIYGGLETGEDSNGKTCSMDQLSDSIEPMEWSMPTEETAEVPPTSNPKRIMHASGLITAGIKRHQNLPSHHAEKRTKAAVGSIDEETKTLHKEVLLLEKEKLTLEIEVLRLKREKLKFKLDALRQHAAYQQHAEHLYEMSPGIDANLESMLSESLVSCNK